MTALPRRIIVADANVLINLMHVNRLDFCSRLPGCIFVVPDHVRDEITDKGQWTRYILRLLKMPFSKILLEN